MNVLVKFRGMLCVMEAVPAKEGQCPDCGCKLFREGAGWATGWTECTNCDFAVLTQDLEKRNVPCETNVDEPVSADRVG